MAAPPSFSSASWQHQQQHALSFRAGKLNRVAGTNTVKPDLRQGVVTVQVGDDELLHFHWKDAAENRIEDDYIIFPDDAIVERAPQTKERVFVLRFKSSGQQLPFWFQDSRADKDDELLARVNALINNTPREQAAFDPSAILPSSSGPSGPISEQELRALKDILSGIQVPPQAKRVPLDLSFVIMSQAVAPLLDNPKICEALFPHLPEGAPRTRQEIMDVIHSPQFKQSLRSLSMALQTGALGPLVQQLGLHSSAANGVEAFLYAVERRAQRGKQDIDQY